MMNNIVREKSFYFAKRIIKLCRYLQDTKREYVLSRQLLRAGTSIGANIAESVHAQSRADFTSKINIALKESAETDYWLHLLYETNYLDRIQYKSIISDCKEIESILASIVKTLKNNL